MAGFNDTTDLERSYLSSVTASVVMARLYVRRATEGLFSSPERKFIYSRAREAMTASKARLTRKLFEYELERLVDKKEHPHYLAEWELVAANKSTDSPDAIIKLLDEARIGRLIMDEAERVVETLEAGRIVDAAALWKRAAVSMSVERDASPVVEITDYEDRKKTIRDKQAHPEKYLGIKTGFPRFDGMTGGLFPKELTLVAGLTGSGKSTFVRAIQRGIILNNEDKNVLHIANEESLEQVQHKFDASLTNIPYNDFKRATITDAGIQEWTDFMDVDMRKPGIGRIFVREVPAFTDVTLVEEAIRELEAKGIKIHVVVIDHLPHVKPIQQAWGENDEKAKAAADCKEIARWCDCAVVVPTQAATEVDAKQEKGKRAGNLDVYGSKAQIHVSNTFIIITIKGKDETQDDREEWEQDVFWMADVKKNRDGPKFWFRVRHQVLVGRVIEEIDAQADAADAATQPDPPDPQQASPARKAPPTSAPQDPPAREAPKGVLEKLRERKKANGSGESDGAAYNAESQWAINHGSRR